MLAMLADRNSPIATVNVWQPIKKDGSMIC